MKLQDALNKYYQDCLVGYSMFARSKRTVENYKQTWQLFLHWLPIVDCLELTDAILRRFFYKGDQERKWQPMTNISHRKNISVFINWAQKKGYLQNNPLKDIPKPRMPQRIPKHHSKAEIERMLYAVSLNPDYLQRIRNEAMIKFCCLAGLRRGELLSMKTMDLNMETKMILVKAETSKSRKERWVPMPITLYETMQKYLNERKLFVLPDCMSLWISTTTKKALSDDGLKHIIQNLSKIVGFNIKLHSLRHSYGTYSYAGSHDIKAVQENMGHSDLSTTMLYVNSLSDDKRQTAEMNPLNNLF